MCAYVVKGQVVLHTLCHIPVFICMYVGTHVVPKVCRQVGAFVLCACAVVCFLQTQSQAGYRKAISQLSDL